MEYLKMATRFGISYQEDLDGCEAVDINYGEALGYICSQAKGFTLS